MQPTTLTMKKPAAHPDTAQLTSWILSWVQPAGAIHGFHNHSVWGTNPFRTGDYTCGHTTFASLLMPALAEAWIRQPDSHALEILLSLIRFQSQSLREDGEFHHIGFQMGEIATCGLVHNAVPCAALCETARVLGDALPEDCRQDIDRVVRTNLAACAGHYGKLANAQSCSNQEFVRLWAMLLHMDVYHHGEWDGDVRYSLDFLLEHAGVRDIPSAGCLAMLRSPGQKEYLEPAEYYGLMIPPLRLAARRYGFSGYKTAAEGLARHVVRSSWTDAQDQCRFHRDWRKMHSTWVQMKEPMLIAGMGLTLAAISELEESEDGEFSSFLESCLSTYGHYQTPGGYFVSASGWTAEQDVAPSSAWHSHDLWHLLKNTNIPEDFWKRVFNKHQPTSVLLGSMFIWIETVDRWALRGYLSMDGFELIGRKDQPVFFVDTPDWAEGGRKAPDDFHIPELPCFARTEDKVIQISGSEDCVIYNASGRTLCG